MKVYPYGWLKTKKIKNDLAQTRHEPEKFNKNKPLILASLNVIENKHLALGQLRRVKHRRIPNRRLVADSRVLRANS